MDLMYSTSLPHETPTLELIINHTAASHVQSINDSVKVLYKPPFSASQDLCQTNQEEADEVILIEEGTDIVQLQQSVISEYRKKTKYYNSLKVSQVRLKVSDNGQEKEVLKIKLVQVRLGDEDILGEGHETKEQPQVLTKIPMLLSSCELSVDGRPMNSSGSKEKDEKSRGILIETYNDSNREMFPVNFGGDDLINVSRNAVDEFRKMSEVTGPLSAQKDRIFMFVNGKETPVTVMHMFPAIKEEKEPKLPGPSKVVRTPVKRGRSRGRGRGSAKGRKKREVKELDEYMSQFRSSKFRRKDDSLPDNSSDLQLSPEDGVSDAEGGGIGNFGCETGIVVNGNAISSTVDTSEGDFIGKEEMPLLELQAVLEDMNASLTSEDIWKYLTQYASEDNGVQGLVTQFNNESWLEVKRMSDFYQVDGEVMTDLSFKVVYKNDFSPVTYFLRGFSRLLKTGELNTAGDINHLFQCMARDRKLCLGLKPSPYQHSIDSNNQVRQHFKEKGQFVSTPFECLLSKSCRGIVKVNGIAPSSTFARGSKTILGVHALCRACAFLGKKMNQLIKDSPKNCAVDSDESHEKMMGDSFLQLLRQPIRRNGMSYSALKYLFTQNVSEILSNEDPGTNQNVVEDTDIDEESPSGGKKNKARLNEREGGASKSGIGMTEESFLQMIDLQPPNSEGLGRSLVKKCNICQFRAPTMLSLITHMKGHLGMLKEKCSQCEIQLSSKEALEIHKRQMHTERSPMCAICQMDFTTNDQLFDHMNKHRSHLPFGCPYCSHKLSNKEAYKKHLRLSHKITSVKDLKFNCKTCNIYFYTRDHVLLHRINQNHEGIEPFICKACAASCVTANEFRHHITEHTEEEREAANLAICPECYKVFFSKYRLTFHIETKHSKTKVKTKLPPEVVVEPEPVVSVKKKKSRGPYLRHLRAYEKYECTRCKRRFKTAATLENHVKFGHAEKKANKTDYVCNLCGRKFNALRRLGNHMKIHAGNRPVFQCEECGQIYGKKTQVLEHIRTDHAEQVERHQQQQELIQVDQSQDQQFVDIQVQQQNSCIEGSASTSWSPIKSPFKVPTVEQTQEAVYSLLQLTDF